MRRLAVRDIGVRFEHADRPAEMIALQGPTGIDAERGAGFRPLFDPAFPSAGLEQNGFDEIAPVGIHGLQQVLVVWKWIARKRP
ncbi:hypothetical protein [Bradyrhizobium sp. Cp5.3]|uniref:hypothetical protein n=1 Tax=Bradyrhizobium sp. Cp5.3 TaxID=443598 RepID=UPI001FD8B483|nr:hypothetical protein [Bradyrhizobium sp. Cp5.3]